MVPAPPEVSQRRGASKPRYCAAHIWCWPTSVETIAFLPARRPARVDISCCGTIAASCAAKSRQRSARQASMVRHQSLSKAGSARRPTRRSSRPRSTAPQSPRRPTSAATTLPIERGSMSMWTICAPGQKSASRPVTRSSKRAPTHTTRSAPCIARFASSVPCMPSMPSQRRSEAGKAPSPIRVSVHGASFQRTRRVKAAQASSPALIKPPPP